MTDAAHAVPGANALGADHDHAPTMPPFRRLLGLVRPDRSDLWAVVVFGLVIGALTLATPIAVQQLVNSVAFGGLVQPVVILALLLFSGLAFGALLAALQAWVAELVQRRIFVRVVADLARRLPRVVADAFDRHHGPELVNRFFDVVTVQKVGATLLLDGVAVVLQTLVGLLVLSLYHPLMLGFSILLVAAIVFVIFVLGRHAVPTAIEESRTKYEVAGWLEELTRHRTAFRDRESRAYALHRADELACQYIEARRQHFRIVLRQISGALGLQVVASSGLLALGGVLVVRGQLTLGQLVASELIVTAIVAAFAKLGKHLESFYDLLAAVDKLGHLFDLPLERSSGEIYSPPSRPAALHIHDARFAYASRPVLNGFSLRLEPGERVALVGPIGAGKSTVIDLAYGIRAPQRGWVTLDGQDLRELELDAIREQVACVRGAQIFPGSILDNVRIGRSSVTVEDASDALKRVGLLEEILDLPDGLGTVLSPEGRPLSSGQSLRLMIARAIARRPRLLLVDELPADLDARRRRLLLETLFAPDRPWTLLVASRIPEVVERCDLVVNLEPRRPPVVEAGAPPLLLVDGTAAGGSR